MIVTNPALGTKRNCPNCNAHFYDLKKNPATCPKCQHQFDPAVAVKSKKRLIKKAEELAQESKTAALARKAEIQKKKKLDDEDSPAHDIEELDDMDDLGDVDELNELEDAEDEQLSEDDADDEAIIDELDTGDEKLVNDVEEEEAESLVEEIEEEQSDNKKNSKSPRNTK